MSPSVKRAAETAITFREANERLEAKADELGLGCRRTPYLCECEDGSCTDVIALTRDEYEDVRVHPKRFVLAPGHEELDGRIVLETPGFTVVEKLGEEGELVAARDPRAVA